LSTTLLSLLHNQIDITQVPFSDRGSRILVNQYPGQSRLYIKLAERLINLQPGLESYLARPPFIQGLTLINESGTALDFEVISSPEKLEFKTDIGSFRLVFHDERTLTFGLPLNAISGLRFNMETSETSQAETGGRLKHLRCLAYESNGKILKNEISTNEIITTVKIIMQANDDPTITFKIYDNDSTSKHQPLTPFSAAHRNAENRWRDWFECIPPVAEPYRPKYAYAWWVMANNLVSPKGYLKYETMMPTKAFYIGAWLWDCALHAIAFRHADAELARNQLRLMLTHQLPDGMLPDAIFDEGVVSEIDHPIPGKVTKPPILAWAALKLYDTDPDIEFLREIYPALVRCNNWWFDANDDDSDGLVQYTHPYSSGLDNSPLWDYGMPVESPDINTYLNIQMNSLAGIAEILEKKDEAAIWRERATKLVQRMMDDLWDEKAGVFNALYNEQPIPILTPFNLYPLWTAQLPEKVAKRLISHLTNPNEFWGRYTIPTVARNSQAHEPEVMWRGPIWANINYFFVEALEKVGEFKLARELRDKTLRMIMEHPGIYEYYNPETGEPAATAANMFGWTAAVFIELALQATNDLETSQTKGIK